MDPLRRFGPQVFEPPPGAGEGARAAAWTSADGELGTAAGGLLLRRECNGSRDTERSRTTLRCRQDTRSQAEIMIPARQDLARRFDL